MNIHHLKDFTKGWFIGNFSPTLFDTNAFEISVKEYKKGDSEASHHHKIATEYTIFHSGKFRMKTQIYTAGYIVEILPGESTDFECLEDGSTTVVKIPCVSGDKYLD